LSTRIESAAPDSSTLEEQLHAKLNLASRVRSGNRTEGSAVGLLIRNAEVGVVQEVEEFAAELQPGTFRNREVFVYSEVPLRETGSAEGVAAEVPERRIGRRQRKGASRLADRRAEIPGDPLSAAQRRQRTIEVRAKHRSAAVFGISGKTG